MPETGKLTQSTRRSFIRGIATAGASTAAVVALERAGIDLFGAATADAAGGTMPFADFNAIAPSAADAFQVPEGFRADLLIRFGDEFANDSGETLAWGYNNDFLAFFPLGGKADEGLLFANHEYPSPFFQHGYKEQDLNPGKHTKSAADVQAEQDAVGNSILHIKRGDDGVWTIVSPSPYNRRIHGDRPALEFTGPRAGDEGIGDSANGSVGNCSGGITPWGTALSCEENFDGYGLALGNSDFQYGWVENGGEPEDAEYHPGAPYRAGGTPYAKYGWVCEHDPYDPSDSGRKHTALGRFRHENTAFRQAPGKPFVLYMGDDKANEGIYRFVSERSFQPGRPANNRRILEEGTLYIARFEPEGRRKFAVNGDTEPTTATEGTGTWVPVLESELDDTATKLRARFAANAEYDTHFATNRPEDVEVHPDGSVFVALTNNSTVLDAHGSVRRIAEAGNDPTALTFTWEDYAAGGPTGRAGVGEEGFSSPDNLVFDSQKNVWVVTDISSSSLNKPGPYEYHANNAVFMVPTTGDNAGVAFRFANSPIEAEITGPYFTPDESTLFVNVQHPGETTGTSADSVFGDVQTYTSWWPDGNRTADQNPSTPLPSLVAVTRILEDAEEPGTPVIPPPAAPGGGGAGGGGITEPDRTRPRVELLSPGRQSLGRLRTRGLAFRVRVSEPVTLTVTLRGQLSKRRGKGSARGKVRRIARASVRVQRAGEVTVRLRPSASLRLLLRRERALPALLQVKAVDAARNTSTRTKQLKFK